MITALASAALNEAWLNRQTMEDLSLLREIRDLSLARLVVACGALDHDDEERIHREAHGLKGTAYAIGAIRLALCAAILESAPRCAEARRECRVAIALTAAALCDLRLTGAGDAP